MVYNKKTHTIIVRYEVASKANGWTPKHKSTRNIYIHIPKFLFNNLNKIK